MRCATERQPKPLFLSPDGDIQRITAIAQSERDVSFTRITICGLPYSSPPRSMFCTTTIRFVGTASKRMAQVARTRAVTTLAPRSKLSAAPPASAALLQSHCRHCRILPRSTTGSAPSVRAISSTPAARADEKKDEGEAAGAAEDGSEQGAAAGGEGAEEHTEEDELMALREQVEALTADNAEQRDRTLRTLAEMENVRTIAQRDIAQAREYSISKFAKGLLDVADNLERALEAVGSLEDVDAEAQPQLHTLLQGVQMTEGQLHKAFGENKLVKFGAAGDAFDPDLHEAMFEAPATGDAEPGSIAHVVKAGYKLNDRVIRWAQVGTVKKE